MLLTQTLTDFVHDRHTVEGIFLDCTKAFDRVDHATLLQKLSALEILDKIAGVYSSYLKDRLQCVAGEGKSSSFLGVQSGVPQGSVLGPQMFLCLLNALPIEITCGSMVTVFADDILLIRFADSKKSDCRPSNRSEQFK